MPDLEPLSPEDERLLPLAMAIADGTPVDWAAASPSATPLAPVPGGSIVGQLQQLERVVRGHEAVRSKTGPLAAAVDETLLTEARLKGRLSLDDPVRVQWGPLVVLEKIGRGSFGDVYRAWDPKLDREVALKLVPEDASAAGSSPVVEEGRLLARVRHPNVLTVHGAERIEGRVGIWTEYVRGETLAQEVARRGPLPSEEVARIGAEVCAALAAVHAAGLLHRDVKAQNVLRDTTGRIVLGDFGTGVQYDEHTGVTEPQIAGTPLYLAPEVVKGGPATVQSDLYSVGVLMYFLVTGDYPVRGRTVAEIKRAHAAGQRVPLRDARRDLPPAFVSLVEELSATSATERPETAAAADAALRVWLAGPVPAADVRPAATHRALRTRALGVAAFAAIILGAVVAGVLWRDRSGATVHLSAGDWILVAGFDNQTGEEVLDGTIEAAVKRELEYSSYIRVAQPSRVEDALLLLGRPPTAPLDTSLAREVAVRDGGIRALLTGSILKAGAAYSVTLDIVNPVDGMVVASVSDMARFADILRTVRRQVLAVRERLGEPVESVEATRRTMSDKTLPALKALHWYAKAHAMFFQPQRSVPSGQSRPEDGIADAENQARLREIERLTRAALQEDPEFAPALALLGPAVGLQEYGKRELAIQEAGGKGLLSYVERAMQMIDRATPGERYAIEGAVHNVRAGVPGVPDTEDQRRELEQAVSAYEALLVLQPDASNVGILSNIYRRLGRPRDATIMALRMAEARPRAVELNAQVANDLFGQGNFEAAQRHAARVASAMSPVSGGRDPTGVARVLLMDAYVAWLQDDPRETLRILDRTAATADQRLPAVARELRLHMWSLHAALGRWRQAAATIELLRPTDTRDPAYLATAHAAAMARGTLLAEMGKLDELRRFAAAEWPDPLPPDAPPVLAARAETLIEAGLLDAAERDVAWYARRPTWSGSDDVRAISSYYRGALELRRGRPRAAIALFEKGRPAIAQSLGGPPWLIGNPNNPIGPTGAIGQFGSAKLAAALEAVGNLTKAIEVLEDSGRNRLGTTVNNTPNRWMRSRAQLARLYRKNGQEAKAKEIEAHLLKLLTVADPDHPLLRELRAGQ